MQTQTEIRNSFWITHPQFKADYRVKKRQNDYCCDIRCAFVDYLDMLAKTGKISPKQADNTTL
jgi:hypothetical protein